MIIQDTFICRAPVSGTLVDNGRREWIDEVFIPNALRQMHDQAAKANKKVVSVDKSEIHVFAIKSKGAKKSKVDSSLREAVVYFKVTLDVPGAIML